MNSIDSLKALVTSRNRIEENLAKIEQDIHDYNEVARTNPKLGVVRLAKEQVRQLENAKTILEMCRDKLDICIQKDRNGEDYTEDFKAFVRLAAICKKT